MGTRGFVGVAIDGDTKLSYNHFDSYPDGLGVELLGSLRMRLHPDAKSALETLAEQARALRMVDEDGTPGELELALFRDFSDPNVGGSIDKPTDGTVQNYYQLLRKLQGDLLRSLDLGLAIDCDGFQFDSLFCEWGYLLDFDANTLQVYQGFQHKRHNKGRWAGLPNDEQIQAKYDAAEARYMAGEIDEQQFEYWSKTEYHAVALVAEWPLDDLPNDDDFLATINDATED